jgi:MFS family permease
MRGDFAISNTELGFAIAVAYTTGAALSWPLGRVVDRIGPVAGIHLGVGLAAVTSLGLALLADSAAAVAGMLLFAGVASAVGSPGATILIRDQLPVHRHGLALGIQQAGAPAGALLSGLMVPGIAIPFGWRAAFGAAAALALATGLAALPFRGRRLTTSDAASVRADPNGRRQARALSLTAALGCTATGGMLVFVVAAAVHAGADDALAGAVLAAASAAALSGRIILGARRDRSGPPTLGPVPGMLALGGLGLAMAATGEPGMILIGAVAAGGLGWSWSGLVLMAAMESNPLTPGAAAGVVLGGITLGAALGPILFGMLSDKVGFAAAWVAAAVIALAAAAVAEHARRAEGRGQTVAVGGV